MFRIVFFLVVFLVLPSVKAIAEGNAAAETDMALRLLCNITFDNYDGVDHTSSSAEIKLSAEKSRPGGAVLVEETGGYQFWAMSHSVQSLGERRFINNFQVAILHKAGRIFMHALSDSSYRPGSPPQYARVSLVDYYPDSLEEKGEILFECRSLP